MTTDKHEALIAAAIQAYDLCGSMQQALRRTARDDYGLSAAQIAAIEGGLLVQANERIRRSVPK